MTFPNSFIRVNLFFVTFVSSDRSYYSDEFLLALKGKLSIKQIF